MNRRQSSFSILLLVLTSFIIAGCPAPVEVTVAPESATLGIGDTEMFTATSTSANDTAFTWESTNESAATVDSSGLVTAVGQGVATIRATGNASGATGEATVTVTADGEPPLSELSVTVEPSVVPITPSLPPLTEGGPERPLAAVVDERGNQAEFVENELLLTTSDSDAVQELIDRWDGEIVMMVDPSTANMAMDPVYLIRIDTDLADASSLEEDLLALDPNARGAVEVSSPAGLGLLAAGAEEARAGMMVGVNWVGRGGSLATRTTTEAATGPSGFNSAGPGYSSDAFDWNFLDLGSNQDIGVTEAWWLLAQADRSNARIPLAILDMGFATATNRDFPEDSVAVSNVPFVDALGTPNLGSCGAPCPWHGTNVANAAMGLVDNTFGGAGPAGPIADGVLVFTSYDFFTGISAIVEALVLGARVLNMSYGADVPAAFAWSVIPFEIATASVSNALIFAAAGNDGRNVDAEDCFIVCWEETWVTPCENNGVICVGGLSQDSQNRASGSNWGPEDVDIFGPYTVIVGSTPSTGVGAQSVSGTSVASPYVAGVAALIWAADPSLTPSHVRTILYNNAHSSPDPRVNRYVNAYDAVAEALGSIINIQQPSNGIEVQAGVTVTFQAFVAEGGRGAPNVTWTSDLSGLVGSGLSTTSNTLPVGSHTITASATFPDSFVVSDTVTVHVQNTPPSVTINSPANGATFFQAQPVSLTGTSIDTNNPPLFALEDDQVSWFVDDAFVANGHAHTIAGGTLGVGSHTIRFEGTDGIETDTAEVTITINENPEDLPPNIVQITFPPQGVSYTADEMDATGWFKRLTLQGNAVDPEDGVLGDASLIWTTSINGGPPQMLGTGGSIEANLYAPECFGNSHTITLTAKDSAGNETPTSVTINVSQFCK